jgi:DNA-binding NarL/FixJ family response regulator
VALEPDIKKADRVSVRKAQVLIVDDHPLVRFGLRQLISDETSLEICGEAESPAQALDLIASLNPDIVVVDISLKDGNGIALIKDAKARFESLKMIVYSMHDEFLFAERALRAGALGYVNKRKASESIVVAILQVLGGKIVVSERVTERMLSRVVASGQQPGIAPIASLSDRELEVFELLGQGLTMGQIAEHLHRSIKTIETYRERIKRKLSLDAPNELIRRATQWVVDGD